MIVLKKMWFTQRSVTSGNTQCERGTIQTTTERCVNQGQTKKCNFCITISQISLDRPTGVEDWRSHVLRQKHCENQSSTQMYSMTKEKYNTRRRLSGHLWRQSVVSIDGLSSRFYHTRNATRPFNQPRVQDTGNAFSKITQHAVSLVFVRIWSCSLSMSLRKSYTAD